jgi:hypothetical protein
MSGTPLFYIDLSSLTFFSYLLSPQNSPLGGTGQPSVRITLLGANSQQPSFGKDPDSLILTEILEFALSLSPPIKGQEPFGGLPHLQPYRFKRALALAEVGDMAMATR